jgi:hypothetical protein
MLLEGGGRTDVGGGEAAGGTADFCGEVWPADAMLLILSGGGGDVAWTPPKRALSNALGD